MNERIQFTVLGDAKPAGSKRAFMRAGMKHPVVVDDNPKSKGWKQEIAAVARQAYSGELLTGPLHVVFRFIRVRPANHYTSKGKLNSRATIGPTTRPDVLKLSRAVEDALTGVIWRDDSQIIREVLIKEWGEPASVEITIEPILF